jgi:hypothetical protein
LLHKFTEDQYGSLASEEMSEFPTTPKIQAVVDSVMHLARALSRTGRCGAEQISPFCVDAMYRVATLCASNTLDSEPDVNDQMSEDIRNALMVISQRWKLAGQSPNLQ